jgi:hypothetical protein
LSWASVATRSFWIRSFQKLTTFVTVGLERSIVTVLSPSKAKGLAPACQSSATIGDMLLPGRSVIYAPVLSLIVLASAA